MSIINKKSYQTVNKKTELALRYVAKKLVNTQDLSMFTSFDKIEYIIEDRLQEFDLTGDVIKKIEAGMLLIAADISDERIEDLLDGIVALEVLVRALRLSRDGDHSALIELDHYDYLLEVHPITLKYWIEVERDHGCRDKAGDMIAALVKRAPTFLDLYPLYMELYPDANAQSRSVFSSVKSILGS